MKNRRLLNILVLIMMASTVVVGVLGVIVRFVVSRNMGIDAMMTVFQVEVVINRVIAFSFIAVLLVNLLNELVNGREVMFKVMTGISLVLYGVQYGLAYLMSWHFSQVTVDQSRMIVENSGMGDYFFKVSMAHLGLKVVVLLCIGAMAIISLGLNKKIMSEAVAVDEGKVITGVVGSLGMNGGMSRGDELWTYRCKLVQWYLDDGVVHNEPISVFIKVADDNLDSIRGVVKKESTVRLSYDGEVSELLEFRQVIDVDFKDEKLEACVQELRRVVTYSDAELGEFVLDKSIKVYQTEFDWCGGKASLFMDTGDEGVLKGLIELYKNEFSEQEEWDRKVRRYVAEELVGLKNDYWLGEDEDELSVEDFESRIKPLTLSIDVDGEYSFWYEDGDIFAGHVIIAYGNDVKGLYRAEMAG